MEIKLKEITIREVVAGYVNNNEEGVVGYGGLLDIRPKYQREFIYKSKKQEAVIDTIKRNFPLGVMYWIRNEDNTFELMDGQQRTISICEYINGGFALDFQYFHNLEKKEKEQILNYKMMIYFCEGGDKEKLNWFKTINIAGEKLSDQELRNAVYTGTWLSDAKRYFSKPGCPAYDIAKDYLRGSAIRQSYLETAINWIGNKEIEKYMAKHQGKPNANELWLYFQSVINWVKAIFPNYRREMKGVPFGFLYNQFKDIPVDFTEMEKEITYLMQDEDVTKKSGIYSYVLTRDERDLNIRSFTLKQRRESYERQKGICIKCGKHFELSEMEADHIKPWREGGRTVAENCQMLCKHDNRVKSGR